MHASGGALRPEAPAKKTDGARGLMESKGAQDTAAATNVVGVPHLRLPQCWMPPSPLDVPLVREDTEQLTTLLEVTPGPSATQYKRMCKKSARIEYESNGNAMEPMKIMALQP